MAQDGPKGSGEAERDGSIGLQANTTCLSPELTARSSKAGGRSAPLTFMRTPNGHKGQGSDRAKLCVVVPVQARQGEAGRRLYCTR